MPNYNYILQPYKGRNTRYTCPSCQEKRTFSRYINTKTSEELADHVGRCDRMDNCGYHYAPKQYFIDNPNLTKPNITLARARTVQKIKSIPVSYIPNEIFKASLSAYSGNCFLHYLQDLFGKDIAMHLADTYHIGSSKYWNGATVFWQVDISDGVRTGKVMLYNPATGKRVKEPYNHINWVHALKDKARNPLFPDYQLKQCLFGEHLLSQDPCKPIALVESEKTAVISSVYLPAFIWLATGGKEGINEDKCKILQNRKVVLYPDLKCLEKWRDLKAMLPQATISSFLEERATEEEKDQGLDLADYLQRFDYRTFTKVLVTQAQLEKLKGQYSDQEVIDINTAFDTPIDKQPSLKLTHDTQSPFEGCTGKVYLPTPGNPSRYAVYNSITAYNNRLHLPDYIDKSLALQDRCNDLLLDYKELQLKYGVP